MANGNDKVKVNAKANAKRKAETPITMDGLIRKPLYEYNMPAAMANDYLADRKAHGTPQEKKMSKYKYLCHMVNEFHGLLGTCVKVHVI